MTMSFSHWFDSKPTAGVWLPETPYDQYRQDVTDRLECDMTTQSYFNFPNGYDVSVIMGPYSYGGPVGLWEAGLLKNNRMVKGIIADDDEVIGYLEFEDVLDVLKKVSEL